MMALRLTAWLPRISSLLLLLAFAAQAEVGTFVVEFKNGAPVLPPMQADNGGVQLCFTNDLKELEGGYSVISKVEKDTTKVLVLVNTTKETLAYIAKMTKTTDATAAAVAAKEGTAQTGIATCEVCGNKVAKTVVCDVCAKKFILTSSIGTSADTKVEETPKPGDEKPPVDDKPPGGEEAVTPP
jgi:hypothetical protein